MSLGFQDPAALVDEALPHIEAGYRAIKLRVGDSPARDLQHRSYRLARGFGRVPLAAGENHFTRYEFSRVIEDGDITLLQPDLSKAGGITELLRIAAMASAYKLPIHPHTCMTGINMAASIHFLAAIDNGGYFEGDVSRGNLYRDSLVSTPFQIGRDGCVRPLEAPRIGVEVDEAFLKAWQSHPPPLVPAAYPSKPGGGTLIGTDAAAKSAPDGYTLFVLPFAFAVNQAIFKKLPYDPVKDFAPITSAASTPNLLVVSLALPVNSVAELLALARAKPGSINYASTGTGSSNHLSMEKFEQMAGVDITHVPYKGSGPAVTDLIGGQVGVMFDNIPNVIQHVKAGKLKALAVSTPRPTPYAPGVPKVAEAGVPQPILDKLNAEIVKVLHMPDVKEKFAACLKDQRARWSKVVQDAGVTPE